MKIWHHTVFKFIFIFSSWQIALIAALSVGCEGQGQHFCTKIVIIINFFTFM